MTINTVSIVFFVIAAVSLLVAIYAFIRFNIPQVIGELSGRTARKSIAQMRDKNDKTGNKAHRPSPSAIERGTLTDKIEKNSKTSKAEKNAEKTKLKKLIQMQQFLLEKVFMTIMQLHLCLKTINQTQQFLSVIILRLPSFLQMMKQPF